MILEIGIAVVVFVICCVLTETEHWRWTTLVVIASCIAVQFLDVVNLWGHVRERTLATALTVLGYLALGVVWSFVKWLSFLLAFRRARRRARETPPRPGYHDSWHLGTYRGQLLGKVPKAADNKGRIVVWVSYWPFSLLGTLVSDPLHLFVRYLFECLSSSYQRVADYIFRDEKA